MTVIPASRFVDALGRTIYTKLERDFGANLTWRTAQGLIVWLFGKCVYVPLFFWRPLK